MTRADQALERLNEKLGTGEHWSLPGDLFGEDSGHIYDFELDQYTFFLDNVASLRELLRGLDALSPLADDALGVATGMNPEDFRQFKSELVKERRPDAADESGFPEKWDRILLPSRFVLGTVIAVEAEAPLGAALVRMVQNEGGAI